MFKDYPKTCVSKDFFLNSSVSNYPKTCAGNPFLNSSVSNYPKTCVSKKKFKVFKNNPVF